MEINIFIPQGTTYGATFLRENVGHRRSAISQSEYSDLSQKSRNILKYSISCFFLNVVSPNYLYPLKLILKFCVFRRKVYENSNQIITF